MPVSLPARIAVLDPGAAAVAQLELGDVVPVLVGEKARVPVAVLVEDRELRAGVRALAAADQPRPLGPGRQVEAVGQLGDPRALAVLAARRRSPAPTRLRAARDRVADRLCQRLADREANLGVAAVRVNACVHPPISARTRSRRGGPRRAAGRARARAP